VNSNKSKTPVVVLMPVHNRKELTLSLLRDLSLQDHKDIKVIVIDDGSTDGTSIDVATQFPRTIILRENGKRWWAESLYVAQKYLEKDIRDPQTVILIINNDVNINESFVSTGIELIDTHPKSLYASQTHIKGRAMINESGVHYSPQDMSFRIALKKEEINCLPTRGLFLRWRDMQEIGKFHPKLLPHYLSDYEYSYRAHRLGFNLRTSDSLSLITHETSSGHAGGIDSNLWVFTRSLFSKRNVSNPVYLTTFCALTSPRKFVTQVPRIWTGFVKSTFRGAIH